MKKAESNTMSLVLALIIGALILLILIVMVGGKVRIFNQTTEHCQDKAPGAECVNNNNLNDDCSLLTHVRIDKGHDCGDDAICCVPLLPDPEETEE
jgi:hypothetical protein